MKNHTKQTSFLTTTAMALTAMLFALNAGPVVAQEKTLDELEAGVDYRKRNMDLLPEGKWEVGKDKWGKIVRVNMLKIEEEDWKKVPGVKKAWPMKGYEGIEGMGYIPIASEMKDVNGDGTPEIFRLRSEKPGARIERLRYKDGSVVWESEPLGAMWGDESRLPVFDIHGNGRYSVIFSCEYEDHGKIWCINAETGETEWNVRYGEGLKWKGGGHGEIVVGHFVDKETQGVVVRDRGILRCYNHQGEEMWTHDTRLRGKEEAYGALMMRCDADGDGLDEIFPNWQKLTMGIRGDGTVMWEDRTQKFHSDFIHSGDVDEDGRVEVVYDHWGDGKAKGPIYIVDAVSGKMKYKIDYRKHGVHHAQNIALGDFIPGRKGLELAMGKPNIYLFSAVTGDLIWKRRPVPNGVTSKGDWDGDGVPEILAFGVGCNVDGIFSVWDGDGSRKYAITFLPSPYNPSDMKYKDFSKIALHRGTSSKPGERYDTGTWRGHAQPGGHEGVRRQVDMDGNGRADVFMPYGEWHFGSDPTIFLMEGPTELTK